jgi:hypothetical protein
VIKSIIIVVLIVLITRENVNVIPHRSFIIRERERCTILT